MKSFKVERKETIKIVYIQKALYGELGSSYSQLERNRTQDRIDDEPTESINNGLFFTGSCVTHSAHTKCNQNTRENKTFENRSKWNVLTGSTLPNWVFFFLSYFSLRNTVRHLQDKKMKTSCRIRPIKVVLVP